MSCVKISQLPFTGTACDTGLVPIVQGGITYSTYACNIGGGGSGGVIIAGTGTLSTIRDGVSNCAAGDCSAAVAGYYNRAGGCGTFIGGGGYNVAGYTCPSLNQYFNYDVIVGGCLNQTFSNCGQSGGYGASTNAIVGGYFNRAFGSFNFVGGGCINTGSCVGSVVVGGYRNCAGLGSFGFIGGGSQNTAGYSHSVVVGGLSNVENSCWGCGVVVGGALNQNYASVGFIGGGNCNFISFASGYSAITGGTCNLSCDTGYSFIGGGGFNTACGSGFGQVVTGGYFNLGTSLYGVIAGGYANSALNCSHIFIGGGGYNTAGYNYDVIGGGCFNCTIAFGGGAAIVGGCCNCISQGCSSFIGGGNRNIIAGGNNEFGVVAGGYFNCICGNASCSSIAGGYFNFIGAAYSGIAGGYLNCVANQKSFIVGSEITTDRACTTFVNNLSIKNIPTSAAGLPAGSVWNNGGVLNIV